MPERVDQSNRRDGTEPAEVAQPAEAAELAEATAPAGPGETAGTADLAEATAPAGPGETAGTAGPAEAAAPAGTAGTADLAEATAPAGPGETAGTAGPAEAAAPAGTAGTAEPAEAAAPAAQPSRWASAPTVALAVATWLVVAAGVALRMRQWLFNRPLWTDELLLYRSTHGQTFRSLLEPLPGSQSAPVGWLWTQHVLTGWFGDSERALRLLPLLFGCGALVLVALLARRLLGPVAALAATFLTACSPQLVYYSNEFKQYSSDVFWTLLVLLVAVLTTAGPRLGRRQAAILGGAAAFAAWFSDATVLACAAVFGGLGLVALLRGRWQRLGVLAASAAPFAVSAGVDYLLVLSRRLADPALLAYWQGTFAPKPLTLDSYAGWLGTTLSNLLNHPLGLRPGWLVVVLLVAGAVAVGLRSPPAVLALVLTAVLTLAAATARAYPFSGRLVLFLAPIAFLVLAGSVDLAGRLARPAGRLARAGAAMLAVVALAGVAVLVAPSVRETARAAARPGIGEDGRTMTRYVADHRRPGDLVLVDGRGSIYAANYYGPRVGLGSFGTIQIVQAGARCVPGTITGLLAGRRYRRVWLVSVHVVPAWLTLYRAELRTAGRYLTGVEAPGGGVEVYDLTAGAEDPGRRSPLLRAAGAGCVQLGRLPTQG